MRSISKRMLVNKSEFKDNPWSTSTTIGCKILKERSNPLSRTCKKSISSRRWVNPFVKEEGTTSIQCFFLTRLPLPSSFKMWGTSTSSITTTAVVWWSPTKVNSLWVKIVVGPITTITKLTTFNHLNLLNRGDQLAVARCNRTCRARKIIRVFRVHHQTLNCKGEAKGEIKTLKINFCSSNVWSKILKRHIRSIKSSSTMKTIWTLITHSNLRISCMVVTLSRTCFLKLCSI